MPYGADAHRTLGLDAVQKNGCRLVVRVLVDKTAFEGEAEDGLAEAGEAGAISPNL
ncbi:MAG: hypothetical protein IPG72_01590 [Ardenticatenales bacterium]|nr:hypothetical protein [Ardenticatenales bacterium]